MPVHPAGPKLFHSIPFRHIARERKGGGGGRGVNVHLNVTPFVDMMTILVTFLLMTFSASGELITAQRGLTLPDATNKDKLRTAPVIIVSRDHITFNGENMGETKSIEDDESMEWKIIELYDRLRAEMQAFKLGFDNLSDLEKQRCANPDKGKANPQEQCLEGLLILQADKDTSAKVLNRILKTAFSAEYPKIMFAVNRRKARAR